MLHSVQHDIKKDIKRIAIVGPESTGKTTLAEQLAKHYNTVFVPEYAREYIGKLKKIYTLKDIEIISKKQLELEDAKAEQANKILFCDTNLIVSKIWAEYVFGKCPQWILDEIKNRHYNFYLLTNIDLPWVGDEQREHPNLREPLFGLYEQELKEKKFSFSVVSGINEERFLNAKKALENL